MIDEIDNSRRFVDERCQIGDQSFKYDRSQMYKDYTLYIKEENPNDWAEFIIPKKDFIKRIDNRFGEATKIGGYYTYKGIRQIPKGLIIQQKLSSDEDAKRKTLADDDDDYEAYQAQAQKRQRQEPTPEELEL